MAAERATDALLNYTADVASPPAAAPPIIGP